jgi:hypothetical protein
MNKYQIKLMQTTQKASAERMTKAAEIVEGIRVLKMYGGKRPTSVGSLLLGKRRSKVSSISLTFSLISQGLACLATFAAYQATGESVTPSIIFTTLTLFISVQLYMGTTFALALESIVNAKVGEND